MLIALHKPYGILSQFTPEPGSKWGTLAEFDLPPNVYPLGRLDADSEGLLLLSDEKGLNTRLLDPERGHPRTYLAQVEGIPSADSIRQLSRGVTIKGYRTKPCSAQLLDPAPQIPPRDPPIRVRKSVPDSWIQLTLTEGKNRQVRRMTAVIGHPTLRLIRIAIGDLKLADQPAGTWRELNLAERKKVLA